MQVKQTIGSNIYGETKFVWKIVDNSWPVVWKKGCRVPAADREVRPWNYLFYLIWFYGNISGFPQNPRHKCWARFRNLFTFNQQSRVLIQGCLISNNIFFLWNVIDLCFPFRKWGQPPRGNKHNTVMYVFGREIHTKDRCVYYNNPNMRRPVLHSDNNRNYISSYIDICPRYPENTSKHLYFKFSFLRNLKSKVKFLFYCNGFKRWDRGKRPNTFKLSILETLMLFSSNNAKMF